jgi:hypothetical protein
MSSYCPSCFRDLPSPDDECRRCARTAPPAPSPLLGVLLFALVLAGSLAFDARLTVFGAGAAVFAIVVQLARRLNA